MADHRGFLTQRERELPSYRPVELRLRDWREVQADREPGSPYLTRQAGRCMDCGIPFCHSGCPLGNLIPEWNDLVWRGEWEAARHQPERVADGVQKDAHILDDVGRQARRGRFLLELQKLFDMRLALRDVVAACSDNLQGFEAVFLVRQAQQRPCL